MELKKFETPTDVFIVGCYLQLEECSFGDAIITDGEHEFVIIINNRIEKRLTSDGFINVMTREEFVKHKEHFKECMIDYDDYVFLPNFTGEIGVKVVALMEGKANVHIDEIDLDIDLLYQKVLGNKGGDGIRGDEAYKGTECCITLPYGTDILRGRYNDDEGIWEVKKWVQLEI